MNQLLDLTRVQELKTISSKETSIFDKDLNDLLKNGWILIKLFEVQESANKHHMYSAQLAKLRENKEVI